MIPGSITGLAADFVGKQIVLESSQLCLRLGVCRSGFWFLYCFPKTDIEDENLGFFTLGVNFDRKGTNFTLRFGGKGESDMIQLLFLVLFVEGAIAFLLLVKIGPLRELVIKSLDQLKMGKGPATVKTIAGTMSVILLSNLMNIIKIQNKGAKLGTMSPMDQVLWRTHLLEASLMGVVLFLGFIIDRTHHYLGKLITLRSNVGSSKGELEQLRKERTELKEKEEKTSKEIKQLKEKLSSVSEKLKKVEKEAKEKETKLETAETHVTALQKQSSELLLEYDRLLEDNQTLQSQILVGTKNLN